MGTKEQVCDLFQSEGVPPKEISHDDVLDMYRVNIDIEDTEDRFIESYSGSGDEPESIDIDELKKVKSRIQFSEIPDGTVVVRDIMESSHFRIQVR